MSTHTPAYTTCAYCPKACRFSCPVSEATQNEALSAWGKMSAVHFTQAEPTPETSRAAHACTGCLRCSAFCKHDNQVGDALFAARTASIAKGMQPKGAASTLATFMQSQNPFGVELGALVAGWRAQRPVRYALFPGCTPLVKVPSVIEDTLAVANAFGAPMGVARVSSSCCGYPLYAAGAHEAFAEHAKAMGARLESVPELVMLDPGCAYTLAQVYPRFGVTVKTRIRTVVEVLNENLAHAPVLPRLEETVAYHDACHLGRGLGQYDAPRTLLRHLVDTVTEADSIRREGGCAGGGGLVPRTMPDTAVEIARRQARALSTDESVAVVTACPTSKRMFERSGRTAFDLVSFVRRWLEQAGDLS